MGTNILMGDGVVGNIPRSERDVPGSNPGPPANKHSLGNGVKVA